MKEIKIFRQSILLEKQEYVDSCQTHLYFYGRSLLFPYGYLFILSLYDPVWTPFDYLVRFANLVNDHLESCVLQLTTYSCFSKGYFAWKSWFLETFLKILLYKNIPRRKSNFVPKGIQIGFAMAGKMCTNSQIDNQTFSYLYK